MSELRYILRKGVFRRRGFAGIRMSNNGKGSDDGE